MGWRQVSAPVPILLRPSADLADAMTRAASEAGCSRQAWMLSVLRLAADPYMTSITPADVPLFATPDDDYQE